MKELENLKNVVSSCLESKPNIVPLIFNVIISRITKHTVKIQYDHFYGMIERLAFFCTMIWKKESWIDFLGRLLISITKNVGFGSTLPQRDRVVSCLLECGKISSSESDSDLVKALTSSTLSFQHEEYAIDEILETFLSTNNIVLKEHTDVHPIISATKVIDFASLCGLANKTSVEKKDKIKTIDKYFEKLRRLGYIESESAHNPSDNICYDSEDEEILDINKKPKSFLLVGEPGLYLKLLLL